MHPCWCMSGWGRVQSGKAMIMYPPQNTGNVLYRYLAGSPVRTAGSLDWQPGGWAPTSGHVIYKGKVYAILRGEVMPWL